MQDKYQNHYQGSTFQKYVLISLSNLLKFQDAYDDEPYELVQDPYEIGNYSHTNENENQPDAPTERKKEPSSPTFIQKYPNSNAQAPSPITTTRMGDNKDSSLVKQLSQKIKKQAEQLQELGNYRLLCERRIQELAPGHPLPVQPSHLGTSRHSYHTFINYWL